MPSLVAKREGEGLTETKAHNGQPRHGNARLAKVDASRAGNELPQGLLPPLKRRH